MYNSQFSCHRCRLGASLTIPEASLFPFLSHLHLCCCSRQGSVGGHVGHPTVPWSVESLNMEFFTIQMISFNTLITSEVDLSILLFLPFSSFFSCCTYYCEWQYRVTLSCHDGDGQKESVWLVLASSSSWMITGCLTLQHPAYHMTTTGKKQTTNV